jgi:hypothetical protein
MSSRKIGEELHAPPVRPNIWRGTHLSQADDFFESLHARHLSDWCPDAIRFLGLPPGWRFLVAPGQEDVWYDATLLTV